LYENTNVLLIISSKSIETKS